MHNNTQEKEHSLETKFQFVFEQIFMFNYDITFPFPK